jgi:regulator of protease activity HflC (stomatin/prohibitin superfamily)
VLVRNIASGQLSMIREPQVFIPDENQETVEVRRGVNLDDETAVLVRDVTSGQLSLITEKQVFIPDENQEIAEVRTLMRLEDHQTVIIRDREGRYTFRRGSDTDRAFFLQPYAELVTLWWSGGLHKDQRNLKITHIDNRPRYMWYEFDVRTQDNVELVIGTTFFWQIVDVEAMIKMTDDATGNISSHARSTIIQAVSRVTLERFLADFNSLVRDSVIGTNDTFYSERGATIHAVEVRSVACKDPQTQQILMEIIQETTNRLNRLQKQESENEVSLKKLQGEIEAEAARGQLLETRRSHSQTESLTHGEAEANRVRVFLEGLGDGLSTADKLAIFTTLRKQEMLDALSKGKATLYFTPSDVDLTIK